MKTIILILTVLSWSLTGTAQEIDPEGLPTATLTTGFYLTLDPEVPVSPYYNVDISHMGFENKLYLVGDKPDLDGDRPLIYREEGSATGIAMNKYFGNEKERKKLNLTSNEAVKQAVIAGLGYSILPIIGIKNEISNGQLHIIDAKGLPMVTNWRIIWLKKKKLAPISKAFLQYIRGKKYEIIQNEFSWYLNFMNES